MAGVRLYYVNGFQNRLLVSLRWAWSLFTHARGSRLITGPFAANRSVPQPGTASGPESSTALADTRRPSSA